MVVNAFPEGKKRFRNLVLPQAKKANEFPKKRESWSTLPETKFQFQHLKIEWQRKMIHFLFGGKTTYLDVPLEVIKRLGSMGYNRPNIWPFISRLYKPIDPITFDPNKRVTGHPTYREVDHWFHHGHEACLVIHSDGQVGPTATWRHSVCRSHAVFLLGFWWVKTGIIECHQKLWGKIKQAANVW